MFTVYDVSGNPRQVTMGELIIIEKGVVAQLMKMAEGDPT